MDDANHAADEVWIHSQAGFRVEEFPTLWTLAGSQTFQFVTEAVAVASAASLTSSSLYLSQS